MRRPVSLRVEPELWKRMKQQALELDMTLEQSAHEAFSAWLRPQAVRRELSRAEAEHVP